MSSQVRIDPSTPVHGREEIEAAQQAAEQWWNVEGAPTEAFERALGDFFGIKYVELVNSGTSANFAALMSLTTDYIPLNRRINKGDEVITTALSFPTTVSPIAYSGAIPVFVDVERNTWNINPEQVREMITDKTKAIMVAHAMGNPFNIEAIMAICEEFGISLIEDNCLVAETPVLTIDGYKPVSKINKGDYVLTRKGFKLVLEACKTGIKPVVKRFGIKATKDHPIVVNGGTKPIDTLSVSDNIYIWNRKSLSIEESNIKDTQIQSVDTLRFTIGTGAAKKEIHYIDKYTGTFMEKSLTALMYTMRMEILLITTQVILGLLRVVNIIATTLTNLRIWQKLWQILSWLGRVQKSGTKVKRVENGTLLLQRKAGKTKRNIKLFVYYAEKLIKLIFQQEPNIVIKNVSKEQEVYNLKVKGCHEFIAGNLLVHNCDCLGGEFNGRRTGSFGHLSTLSFYPAHHISTGEGGAVMTNNFQIQRGLNAMINWGRDCYCPPGQDNTCGARYGQHHGELPRGYDHKNTYTEFGFNMKMSQIQAAIGVEQMKRLPGFIRDRQFNHQFLAAVFSQYKDWFEFTEPYEGAKMSPFGYVVKLSEKAPFTKQEFEQFLDQQGIRSRAFFCGNITKQPVLSRSGKWSFRKHPDLSVSDDIMDNSFWIGVHPGIQEAERAYMKEKILEFLGKYK